MNINYAIILTKNEIESINQEKYDFINQISMVKTDNYDGVFNRETFARELVFLKNYKNEDFLTKTLTASKITYNNSEMLINILLSKNITYDKLERIINKIDKIKQLAISGNEILDENIIITDKNLNYICNTINKYYNNKNGNYLIAKLIDIVVNEKELYLSLQGEKVKKH